MFQYVNVILSADVSGEKYDNIVVISGLTFDYVPSPYNNTGLFFMSIPNCCAFNATYIS
ncbi:hypothetical protein H5410_031778 [Solanum commersonii]|uniref:Uncharacterized protein n=1 Tax=Solanum commersonii TaxID=4109 RepID=A0A9J5YL42_SOLCO|nr:hypothetical protein H5410_031778 [Solanum commersonii]